MQTHAEGNRTDLVTGIIINWLFNVTVSIVISGGTFTWKLCWLKNDFAAMCLTKQSKKWVCWQKQKQQQKTIKPNQNSTCVTPGTAGCLFLQERTDEIKVLSSPGAPKPLQQGGPQPVDINSFLMWQPWPTERLKMGRRQIPRTRRKKSFQCSCVCVCVSKPTCVRFICFVYLHAWHISEGRPLWPLTNKEGFDMILKGLAWVANAYMTQIPCTGIWGIRCIKLHTNKQKEVSVCVCLCQQKAAAL